MLTLRDFRDADAATVDRLAVAAFEQYGSRFSDWPAMAARIGGMSALNGHGEIIVAELDGTIAGAVAYLPPGAPKADYYEPDWPTIRLLVVDPARRGHGIGRALTEECIARAKRDRSGAIALHTSTMMTVALPMYLRMGFAHVHDIPPIYGVPYAVYLLRLEAGAA